MKILLKSKKGIQGLIFLSDMRPGQLQQCRQTLQALMFTDATHNLLKKREKQPLNLVHKSQALLSEQVEQGCDDTQVQPTASHKMHKLHKSLICIPLYIPL